MEIEFDPAKNEKNILERGLPFTLAHEFDFTTALLDIDVRKDYGETRYRALGLLNGRLHVLIFVVTTVGIRVISLRKANKREVGFYESRT
ncbi:MAG: BrnT family toxin [Caldilineales bacterium]|nr:BrnT family toxin [Caldilineales bacterium]